MLWRWIPEFLELLGWRQRRFKPCVVYNPSLRITEMLLEDTTTVWHPWGPYQGHAVDVGYARDGHLVGIKIWDDVTKPPERGLTEDERQLPGPDDEYIPGTDDDGPDNHPERANWTSEDFEAEWRRIEEAEKCHAPGPLIRSRQRGKDV